MIIILDGSKGAGKSTTAKLLCDVLNDSIVLSLDHERDLLVNQEGRTIQARNKEAFEVLLNKCASSIDEGKTQIERVRQRDAIKGKETDENRFKNVHDSLHSKSFEDFIIIDTDKSSPEEVVNIILRNV